MPTDPRDDVIAAQIAYYRARAPEYDATFGGSHDPALVAALDAFAPRGRVLELACGTGAWTEHIVRHPIDELLAVDAAPEMLELHARRVPDPRVTRQAADIFSWQPSDRFDDVTFAFWLSHVPPARLDEFFAVVDRALEPGGRVMFVDEDDRHARHEQIGGDADYPTVERPLLDGRRMTAVKVYYDPGVLEARLRAHGWAIPVHRAGDGFLWGAGGRA